MGGAISHPDFALASTVPPDLPDVVEVAGVRFGVSVESFPRRVSSVIWTIPGRRIVIHRDVPEHARRRLLDAATTALMAELTETRGE